MDPGLHARIDVLRHATLTHGVDCMRSNVTHRFVNEHLTEIAWASTFIVLAITRRMAAGKCRPVMILPVSRVATDQSRRVDGRPDHSPQSVIMRPSRHAASIQKE